MHEAHTRAVRLCALIPAMLDPCIACTGCRTAQPPRKADCLAPYPNLRAIGNSPTGFRHATAQGWSPAEIMFYNRQIALYYPRQSLPDLL